METFTRKCPTDEMFTEEMSLKDWVKQSIPLSVVEVIDANLLKRGEENFNAKLDCMLSVIRGGATLSLGGAVAPAKKKKYPLECVRKLIGPPYVGHLAPPYLTILLVKSHQF